MKMLRRSNTILLVIEKIDSKFFIWKIKIGS